MKKNIVLRKEKRTKQMKEAFIFLKKIIDFPNYENTVTYLYLFNKSSFSSNKFYINTTIHNRINFKYLLIYIFIHTFFTLLFTCLRLLKSK